MVDEKNELTKLWDSVPGYDFDESVDVPALNSWFFDGAHSVPRWTPMFSWFWNRYCGYSFQYAAEKLSMPRFKGFTERDRNGASYLAMYIVRDEEEIERRTDKFKEVLIPWIEDFDGLWGGYKKELTEMYDNLRKLDLETAGSIDLMHHLWDLIAAYRRMWEIHSLGLEVSGIAFLQLESLVAPYGLTTQSPEFQNMFRGFDNKCFQVDKQVMDLGHEAAQAGLDEIIKNNPTEKVIERLQQSDEGKKWLDGFYAFLNREGWRMVRMNDFDEPYWLEDPSILIKLIQDNMKRGDEHNLNDVREALAAQREKAIAEFLNKVPDDEKAWFEALIRLAGKASSYSEEHDLYCELECHALCRRGLLGIGRHLAKAGTIDKPDDIFFLNPDEAEMVMMAPEYHKLQHIANRRRSQWEGWKFEPTPPVITNRANMEEAIEKDLLPSADPVIIKIVVGEMPNVRETLKADIYGVCGAPGVAEGPARVIMSYGELDQVQKGEILVCPGTNPAWTPVFGIIKALVADRGGTLSHSAIVGREYGIPTLVNTFEGTAKIKTGQRIRVDATEGAIYFVD
jgi:pyruvate,water dikinase